VILFAIAFFQRLGPSSSSTDARRKTKSERKAKRKKEHRTGENNLPKSHGRNAFPVKRHIKSMRKGSKGKKGRKEGCTAANPANEERDP
jgi:hypothetical protein